ncbi:MAG: hypothetical protein SGPRY_005707, partial [Prymnesium sp.]
LFVSSIYRLSGVHSMKHAIYSGGPISCGVAATAAMENYTGGVFSQPGKPPTVSSTMRGG